MWLKTHIFADLNDDSIYKEHGLQPLHYGGKARVGKARPSS